MSEAIKQVPAFPQPDVYHSNGQVEIGYPGMMLRDYFAKEAMAMHCNASNGWIDPTEYPEVTKRAYAMADAMMKAREL